MADGLIPNDAANNPYNNHLESPPTYDQAVSGAPGPQRTYSPYAPPSPFQPQYGPPPPQPQYGDYSQPYPNPQQPQGQMYQPMYAQSFYGNPQQPQYTPQQPQYAPPQPQYGAPNYPTYGAPQQQQPGMYQSGYPQNYTADAKIVPPNQYGAQLQQPAAYQAGYQSNFGSDMKGNVLTPVPSHQLTPVPSHQLTPVPSQQLTQVPSQQLTQFPSQQLTPLPTQQLTPTPTQQSGQVVPYQHPPERLGSDVTNVQFSPVKLHGDEEHHALKAIHEISTKKMVVAAALVAIVGTYLMHRHQHEKNKVTNNMHLHGPRGTTEDVALYNHQMDNLESLSGKATMKHHLHHGDPIPVEAWTEAIQPHRRAIFAQVYNSNPNVRAFCSGDWNVTEYPQLDDWALGRRTHNLSFQRAGQRMPNWGAARELLGQVRTVVLLDDSSSMMLQGHSAWSHSSDDFGGRGASRWEQAKNLLAGIAPLVAAHNRHGIDIHFLNDARRLLGVRTSAQVRQKFHERPSGATPTGRRVNEILDGYMCALRYNRQLQPLNLVVITDGEAQDEDVLHWAIEEHVTKMVHRGFPEHQFGIEFLQVGDDYEATRHLERLEEEVSRHHSRFQRDVVGVTPATRQRMITPDILCGIILSGIDARMNGYMRHKGIDV